MAVTVSGCTQLPRLNELAPDPLQPMTAGWGDVARSLSTSADKRLTQYDEEFGPATVKQRPDEESSSDLPQGAHDQTPGTEIELASATSGDPGVEADVPLKLSVMDAINAAAHNNPRIRVLSYLPLEAAAQTEIEQARFDTTLNAGAQLLNANQQVASAVQANAAGRPVFSSTSIGPANNLPNVVQLEKRFTSGTIARIGAGANYDQSSPTGQFLVYNPAYQSGISAVIEQPLFRGFGSRVNLAGARLAVMGHQKSLAEFQAELNRTLNDVQQAYWLAWLAQSEVATYDRLVGEAELTLQIEQRRLELGEGGLVETAQATENLAALRVESEKARQRHLSASNRLKAIMGLPADDPRDVELIELPFDEEFKPDLQAGLDRARQSLPELQARQVAVQQAQLELDRVRNGARPDLSAYAGYGLTGLDSGVLGSLSNLTSAEYGNLTMGVRFQHVFGRRAEKAAVEQSEYVLQRQLMASRQAQQELDQRVKEAHDAILSAWQVLERQSERAQASQMQFDTYDQLYQAGQLELDRLIRARTLLANALQERAAALIDYNFAIANWNYTIGVAAGRTPGEDVVSW